jgi:hypothetical protein
LSIFQDQRSLTVSLRSTTAIRSAAAHCHENGGISILTVSAFKSERTLQLNFND